MSHHVGRTCTPPAAAELFVAALVEDSSLREAILGDLCEEHTARARQESPSAADRWYWSEVARSTLPLLWMTRPRPGSTAALQLLAALATGFALVGAITIGSLIGIGWTFAVMSGQGYASGLIAFAESGWFVWLCSAMVVTTSGVTAGYAMAFLHRRAALGSAIALGLVCVPMSAVTIATNGTGAPVWHEVAFSLLVLPGAVSGALLRARHSHARAPWRRPA